MSRDLHINLNMKILKLTLQNGKTREIPSFLGKLAQNENFEINTIKWQDPSYPRAFPASSDIAGFRELNKKMPSRELVNRYPLPFFYFLKKGGRGKVHVKMA